MEIVLAVVSAGIGTVALVEGFKEHRVPGSSSLLQSLSSTEVVRRLFGEKCIGAYHVVLGSLFIMWSLFTVWSIAVCN